MKRIAYFLLFLILAGVSSFAQEVTIYLEGVGTQEQVSFFRDSFAIEVPSYGYRLVDSSANADYSIRYVISPQGRMFTLEASIVRLSDRATLASNSYYFEYLEDMLPYNQLVIFTLVNNIPKPDVVVGVAEDDSWRNKWLYLRASLDYPISFYTLLGTGLIKNSGVYFGKEEKPDYVMPIDNRIVAMPAITLGVEVQVLSFLSIEPFAQVNWDHMNEKDFFSFAAGLEVKFPLKFVKHVMLEPYLAGLYTLPFTLLTPASDIFVSTPLVTAGAGVQLSIKRGKADAIFFDIGYWYDIGDVGIKNHYKSSDPLLKDLAPNPETIHFQRSIIRIGVGYKFGLFNRK
jgi:hypothetical protein